MEKEKYMKNKKFMVICRCDDTIQIICAKSKQTKTKLYKQFDMEFDEYNKLQIFFDNIPIRIQIFKNMVDSGDIDIISQTTTKNYAHYILFSKYF